MTNDDKTTGSGVPENDAPSGAGSESQEEGAEAMKDADDAVVEGSAEGSNSQK